MRNDLLQSRTSVHVCISSVCPTPYCIGLIYNLTKSYINLETFVTRGYIIADNSSFFFFLKRDTMFDFVQDNVNRQLDGYKV